MALSWSHSVIYVHDVDRMLDFYNRVLGFQVTDRGPVRDTEIVFMSQQADEHHQIGLMPGRAEVAPSNSVAHLAFRVENLDELRRTIEKLEDENVTLRPTSHGNTWSVYFQDPEQNGVEIFCDTPWHVGQPQGQAWDMTLDDKDLLAWTEAKFKSEPGFGPRADYVARRRQELADS